MPKPPPLSHEDRDLWRHVTKTVLPLGEDRRDPSPMPSERGLKPVSPLKASSNDAKPSAAAPSAKPAALRPGHPAPGVDAATDRKLQRGRLAIDAVLDLHGMSRLNAFHALSGFVVRAHAAGHRCVLVITGQGKFGGGVIKQALPGWINEPEIRHYVLSVQPAQPRDGGAGAFYLLIRRKRG